jgi:hypothetical protein
MAGPDLGYGVSCDEDPPAPRCDLSPSEANWGPASIVAEIRLADGDCCFDHTGDGVNDNELGNMLFAFSESDSQDAIDSQIASGNFVLLLEYPGLMDKTNDDTFRTYAYRGEGPVPPDSNTNEVSVAREDLAEGAFAAHRFVESNLSGGDISAREGEVWLPLPLPGFADLQVPVVDARVELSVNTAGTGLPQPGVKADGIIGGAVLATGLFGALSAEAESQCPCLELSDAGPYISEDGACNPNLSSNAGNCSMLCADVAAACGEYAGFLNDLDVAIGGGDPNAMSLGYEFSVAPAEITGAR